MKQPRYQAIAQSIKTQITAGRYTPGEKIPSIRMFADQFGCNKLTVHRAFEMLSKQGLIENRVGSGSYVRFPEKISQPSGIFDFHTDYLDASLFPYDQIQAIINQLFVNLKAHALAPSPAEGDPDFIGALSQYYHVPAHRMLAISGAQQGLDLVAKVFATNISETMLFEDPTYPGAISLFKARHFVPLDGDGPDLDRLGQKLQGPIQLFYTMPSVHNPTGMAYTQTKKEAVAQLALQHGFYIIEDDFLSEFRTDGGPRFVDICPEQTIHIKSLSQTTVAGIRLGFMVVPERLYAKFRYAKFSSDIASPGLMQRCMRDFFLQGLYQQHLDQVLPKIVRRKQRLFGLIATHNHLSASPDQVGYSLWVQSRKPITLDPVPWSRGREFSFSPKADAYFRLSFMHMNDAAFDQGLAYLDRLWT
jgi:2-aminoadipate transaminase